MELELRSRVAGADVAPAPRASGKLQIFEETVLPHLNAAYNLARWLLRNDQDAHDVVQESFLRAYRFFEGWSGANVKAWLLAIVRNTCLTWRQRARRDESTVPFDELTHSAGTAAANVEDRMVEAGRIDTLRRCMEALPADHREILILREFEEMSYKQIAETTNLPVGTVMSRLSRARQRLEQCMTGQPAGAEK